MPERAVDESRLFAAPLAWVAAFLVWLALAFRWWAPVMDPDSWWLRWAGERMLAGKWPDRNGLSYTAPEMPWTLHEPLVALLYGAGGERGILALRCVVLALTGGLLLRLAWRPRSGWATALALSTMPVLLFFGLSERALAYGNLMLAATLVVLHGGREPWRLPLAVLLVVLWANVHGSFIVGVGIVTLFDWRYGMLAAAGTLLNPNGWHLYGLLAEYALGLGAMGVAARVIPEWGWLDPTQPAQLIPALWCVAVALLFFVWGAPRRDRILALAMCLLVARSWRNAPVAGLCLVPGLAAVLEPRLPWRPAGRPWRPYALLMLPTLLAAFWIRPDTEVFPPEVLAALEPDDRIYNDHGLGGWLGYHGFAVFWDGRNDCYPVEVFEQGVDVAFLREGWRQVLDDWGVDTVVTRRKPLVAALQENGWRVRETAHLVTVLESRERPTRPRRGDPPANR